VNLFRNHRSRCAGGLVVILGALGAVAITGGTTSATAVPHGSRTSIVFGLESESPNYVPGGAALSYSGGAVERAIYDPLTQYNAKGVAVPFLATSVVSNKALTAWTVKIPGDIRFEDGSKLTAADIVSDFENYYEGPGSGVAATFAVISKATAPNKTTVNFFLHEADGQLPALLTQFYPFNPDLKTIWGTNYGAHPDGTGPFKLVSWTPNSDLVLKANPYYWQKGPQGQKLPYLKTITMNIIPDGQTRVDGVQSGELAGFQTVEEPTSEAAVQAGIKKILKAPTGGAGIFFNTNTPPFDSQSVRQGLAYASDDAAVVAALGGKKSVIPVDEYYVPGSPFYSSAVGKAFPSYDTSKATSLLNSYINSSNRSDHQPSGSPITVPLLYVVGDAQSTATVQVIQAEWQAVGVKVNLVGVSQTTEVADALGGSNTAAFFFEWGASTPYVLWNHNYSNPATNPTNWTRLNDPLITAETNGPCAVAQTNLQLKNCATVVGLELAKQVPVDYLYATSEAWVFSNTQIASAQLDPGGPIGVDSSINWATLQAK
jgi:ABC-type transport system substrate-binding protein